MSERLLVNFFYAHPVGHAVEALHYCAGYHAADPERTIGVVLNAASAVELADLCPFVAAAYPVSHPLLSPCEESLSRLTDVPREWDWVLDDGRRYQPFQLEAFPGLRSFYEASDRHFVAAAGRRFAGADPPGYVPHTQLRFSLPASVREAAAARVGGRAIAVMPAGSSDRSLYPSAASWLMIFDALTDALPDVRIALVGRLADDERTSTAIGGDELAALLGHRSRPVDCFDLGLHEQLAVVEACDVFVAPHTGFGMAALAVATPWLAISGGRWFEYFFNHVPFRSIIPDPERYPSFSQFSAPEPELDGDDGPRIPSMARRRIAEDLDRIVAAAHELSAGSLSYEQALRDYFAALLAAHGGDPTPIWSLDGVHADYLPRA